MKIMFNRPVKREPWGGGSHFITALFEHLTRSGHEVVFSLSGGIDVIFMFDPRPSVGGDCANSIYRYKVQNPGTRVIQRINDTDIARPKDKPWRVELLLWSNQIADHTVFISNWVKDHYIERGFQSSKAHSVIINGCNSEWYFPKEKEINKSKVKLITHHWSDNFSKGFDIYNFLDKFSSRRDDLAFTYMGRYNSEYKPENTRIIDPKYGSEVGEILRDHDIYVTAARNEACGMHHIEGAMCGLPVLYHADGGAIPEVCNPHGVSFSSVENFEESLNTIISKWKFYRDSIDYDFLSMKRCCKEYERIVNDFKSK